MKHLLLWGMAFAAFHISHSNIPDFCALPADQGQGREFLFVFHYDPAKDQCVPFLYNGEGGNGNRFQNERQCIRNCSSRAAEIYPENEVLACHFKKAPGDCSGNFLRYYYDAIHGKCKKFIWTGCIGNGNRFFDQTSCNATCAGIHDDGEEAEEDEPDTPVAIICGVLLAVLISAILITVIVLTVKSRSKKRTLKKSNDPKSESPLNGTEME